MNGILQSFFNTSRYDHPSDISRARIAYGTSIVFAILFSVYAFTVPFATPGEPVAWTFFERAIQPNPYAIYSFCFVAFYTILAGTLMGIQQGRLDQVALGPALMLYLGVIPIAMLGDISQTDNGYLLIPALLTAVLIGGRLGLVVFAPVHMVLITYGYVMRPGGFTATWDDLVVVCTASLAILLVTYLFNRSTQVGQMEGQFIASRKRLQLAQLTTRIVRSMMGENLDDVLMTMVHDIRDKFPTAYHAQVFLIDEDRKDAKLVASTGRIGRLLLDRQHSLPVGSLSVIGQVTGRGDTVVAEVGAENSVHRPNDLLPETRLEAAFPLRVGNRILGALDLQSKQHRAFDDEDLAALQAIADIIAITIDNTRLLEQTQHRLVENQRLVAQMQSTQGEVQRLNRELTKNVWTDYLRNRRINLNLDMDFESHEIHDAADWTQSMDQAIAADEIVSQEIDGQHIVTVPLRVRGELIGAMEFEVEDPDAVTSDELEMLREVGERFGVAAENNRLYEQTQRNAQREALVNEIGARIQGTNSVEGTLMEAARGLRDALNASKVEIRLGPPPQREEQTE